MASLRPSSPAAAPFRSLERSLFGGRQGFPPSSERALREGFLKIKNPSHLFVQAWLCPVLGSALPHRPSPPLCRVIRRSGDAVKMILHQSARTMSTRLQSAEIGSRASSSEVTLRALKRPRLLKTQTGCVSEEAAQVLGGRIGGSNGPELEPDRVVSPRHEGPPSGGRGVSEKHRSR
jgi:hypothetical protein